MKKPITRPKDYTNCHPVIAEALKQGLEIECTVGTKVFFVIDYQHRRQYPYVSDGCNHYRNAEPYERKPRLKPFLKLMNILYDSGFRPNDAGHWVDESGMRFAAAMVNAAARGEILPGYEYRPEWLE